MTSSEVADPLGLVGITVDDKYVVERVVGEGGFAVVYRAMHKLWQRPVALKCFKTMMDASPVMREKLLQSFVQEGALLTELSARSASIVQARDIGTLTTPNGAWVPYMVLEWLEGTTLDAYTELHAKGPWEMDRVMTVLEPVAEALELAHRRNVAHRDIKPANIFLVFADGSRPGADPVDHQIDQMRVKLLDFGIAKVVQTAADQGFTQTGGQVTSFTPSFGAPEQFSRTHGATGPWTDVYALALIVSELLSGRMALEGDDFIQLGMASADPMRRPTPRALGAAVSDEVEAVLAKALAISPTARFQSAGEFWNALRKAIGEAPLRRVTTTPAVIPPSHHRGAFAQTELPGSDPAGSMSLGGAAKALTAPGAEVAARPSDTAASKRMPMVLGGASAAVLLAGGAFYLFGNRANPPAGAAAAPPPQHAAVVVPAAVAGPPCPEAMAVIPGGPFFMGSDKGDDVEKPAHKVVLSPYCMDLKEVTVAAYKACSDRGECKRAIPEVDFEDIDDRLRGIYGPLCTIADPVGKADHPINCVDWEMARGYCESNGKRLPTEAEWEFAARGPDGRIYPWGDEPPDPTRLNACGRECVAWGKKVGEHLKAMYEGDDGFPATAPVGKFPAGASRYGLLDVVGNVWEWTSDWDGRYGADPHSDPKGPETGTERAIRGGAWNGSFPSWVRPSQRYSMSPKSKSHVVGFRCAKPQNATGPRK